MANPFTNSAAGNALAGALVPSAAKLSKAMAPKTESLPTMDAHADAVHPVPSAAGGPPPSYVTMTPNRVTGKFAK